MQKCINVYYLLLENMTSANVIETTVRQFGQQRNVKGLQDYVQTLPAEEVWTVVFLSFISTIKTLFGFLDNRNGWDKDKQSKFCTYSKLSDAVFYKHSRKSYEKIESHNGTS